MPFKFEPTDTEKNPANWTPDQQQAWNAHKAEQFAKGLPPYPSDQFMLVHHGKFGLDVYGQPKPAPVAAPQAGPDAAPAADPQPQPTAAAQG